MTSREPASEIPSPEDVFALFTQRHQAALDAYRESCREAVCAAGRLLLETLRAGGKILICGNGGSAADAQHMAAEIAGRFERDRPAWPAIALTTDTSILTAVGNDLGFERVFARQVEALGRPGDTLLAISTCGVSPNLLAALQAARAGGMKTLGLAGRDGGAMPPLCDLCLLAPGDSTARIQEMHILTLHIWCAQIERALSPATDQ